MTEKNGVAKVYSSQEIELNISHLRADIKSGKVKGIEIVTQDEIVSKIRTEVGQIAPKADLELGIAGEEKGIRPYVQSLNLSKTKTDKLERLLRAYLDTTRDNEFLVKGVIPKEYYIGPYPAAHTR
jgi:hypothetical protein